MRCMITRYLFVVWNCTTSNSLFPDVRAPGGKLINPVGSKLPDPAMIDRWERLLDG